jgi:DeoR/GlpR family transcriptional regulator of sugar metabolism
MLEDTGAVQVADLVARYDVTGSTIRRDLDWLEGQGLARRVYGGALKFGPKEDAAHPPVVDDLAVRIGESVADIVQSGDTLFIGPGELTLASAQALGGCEGLTVVTNSLAVAQAVAENTSHNLILAGGQLDRADDGLTGNLTDLALRDLRADRIILDLSGIDALDGLTDDSLPQAELARRLLNLGAEVVVLVAPERVGRVAAAHIGSAAEADIVVTAREADSAPLWDLTELGLRVVLA